MNRQRLLVIDDEADIGSYIANVAENCGYRARATEQPGEFKDACAEFAPHVVVLDLAIPDTDGIELLRFLADFGYTGQVLILSGFDRRVLESAERLGRARGLNMAGALTKPVRVPELRVVLANLSPAA
jgi:DNA-binding response OmpR family regulator